jgi:competence protein ComEA
MNQLTAIFVRLRSALRPELLLRAAALAVFSALLAAVGAGVFDPLPFIGSAQAAPLVLRAVAPLAEERRSGFAASLGGGLAPSADRPPTGVESNRAVVLSASLANGGAEPRIAHPHEELKKVVLNTASAAELCSLPGIGPKRAEQILLLREKLGGRFRRIEDLRRVRGIGRKALERLKPLVVLDPPEPPPEAQPGATVPAPPAPRG